MLSLIPARASAANCGDFEVSEIFANSFCSGVSGGDFGAVSQIIANFFALIIRYYAFVAIIIVVYTAIEVISSGSNSGAVAKARTRIAAIVVSFVLLAATSVIFAQIAKIQSDVS